jgi:hypothetical protein
MITSFFSFKFLFQGVTITPSITLGANQLHTLFAKAPKVFWPTFNFHDNDAITMRACKRIVLFIVLTITKDLSITTRISQFYCSSK